MNKRTVEFALTIAAIPVTIVILFMAGFFTRSESKVGMVATIVSFSVLSCWSQYTNANNLVSVLCWLGLFRFQARSNVSTCEGRAIQARTKIIDGLCRNHHHPDHPNNHQRVYMYCQLQSRAEAAHQRKESRERR